MILVDYSQIAISNIMQFKGDLHEGCSEPNATSIIRHAILSGIKSIKKTYTKTFGEMVIACDGKNVWRKNVFEHYKAGRSSARDKSEYDWKLIFNIISTVRDELAENFPYRVIHLEGAEGDDVIAVLTKWAVENPVDTGGIFPTAQPVLILSSDEDFFQLQKYPNVRQYAPSKGQWLICEDPQAKLNAHIAKAGDDGIPNVLSDPAVFVTEGIRQTPMRKERLQTFVELGREACENDLQRSRWDLNNILVNFECIPKEISEAIVAKYIDSPVGNRSKIYSYLIKNRCKQLLESIDEF